MSTAKRIMIGSLFSGIGGFDLGVEAALRESGFEPTIVFQVEIDPFCRAVLARHFTDTDRSVIDVRAAASLPSVDLIIGGFPCQDISGAGRGEGLSGARSGLWWAFRDVVAALRPGAVLVENVASGLSRWLGPVRCSLEALGYRTDALQIGAHDVGAPHRRERVFVLAHTDRGQLRLEPGRVCWSCGTGAPELGYARAVGDAGEPGREGASGIGLRGAEWADRSADTGGRIGEAERGLGGSAPRLSSWMDRCGFQTHEGEQKSERERLMGYGQTSGSGFRKDVREVRIAADTQEVQWPPGRPICLPASQILRSHVQWAGDSQGCADTRCVAETGGEVPRGEVRDLRDGGISPGSPRRQQPGEQRAEQPDDALRGMPYQVALATREDAPDAGDCATHRLPSRWPAARGEDQHAWEPPRTIEGREALRRSRLKALGNAVVPAQGREAMRWAIGVLRRQCITTTSQSLQETT